jgi:hypothetical protein
VLFFVSLIFEHALSRDPPPSWSTCNPYLQFRTVPVAELPSLGEGTAGTRVNLTSGLPVDRLSYIKTSSGGSGSSSSSSSGGSSSSSSSKPC